MRSAQEELEIKQRVEEDRLMKAMLQERAKDAEILKAEMDQEWEVQIKELASKYEKKGTKKDKKVKTRVGCLEIRWSCLEEVSGQ